MQRYIDDNVRIQKLIKILSEESMGGNQVAEVTSEISYFYFVYHDFILELSCNIVCDDYRVFKNNRYGHHDMMKVMEFLLKNPLEDKHLEDEDMEKIKCLLEKMQMKFQEELDVLEEA